jgi:hypothetical protein
VLVGATTWLDVPNYVEVELDATVYTSNTATVRATLFAGIKRQPDAAQLPTDGMGFRNWSTDPTPASDVFTVMCWVRVDVADPGPTTRVMYLLTDEADSAYWLIGAEGELLRFYVYSGGTDFYIDAPGAAAAGPWRHLCLVSDHGTHRAYVDGVLVGTDVLTLAPPGTDPYELLGAGSGEIGGYSVAEFRRWTAALTGSEVAAEMASASLVRTEDVFRDVALAGADDGMDQSGEGHDFEVVGSMADTIGPRGGEALVPPVRARLRNMTDSTTAGESAVVVSTSPVVVDFPATITGTGRRYRLQVGSSVAGADLFAGGGIDAPPTV